jgi:hypothetical protein
MPVSPVNDVEPTEDGVYLHSDGSYLGDLLGEAAEGRDLGVEVE